MIKLLAFTFPLLLGMVLEALPLAAQTGIKIYVDRNDPTCGGRSPCFTTIQAAINAAGPRATIQIQAGVYPEQLQIQKNDFAGAVEADRIVIEADPNGQPGQVVLTGAPGACTGNHAIRLQQSKFVTIRGLVITGTGGPAISLLGGNNGSVGVHIELNRIFGNGSSSCNGGITVARNNPGTVIANNLVYANGRNGITFIDADGGPHYIVNNTIYANQWNGLEVARQHQVTIVNNIINANGTAAGTTGGRFGIQREGSSSPQPQGIKLLNNLICGNTRGQINGPVLDPTDSGNFTPLGNEGPGVAARAGCDDPANLFTSRNGLDGIPNTGDDDFSLKSNSLAIDVGIDPRSLGLDPGLDQVFIADFVQDHIRPADGNADRIPAFDASAHEFPNAPPVANAGANQTVVTGQLITLNGTQSLDPENATLVFQWSVLSQPADSNVALNDAATATPSYTPLVAGDYNFQLIVNDGQFASAPSTVRVTVIGSQAPVAHSTSATVAEDTPLAVVLGASDTDSSSLSFSIVSGPSHGTLGTISTPNCAANGTGTDCTVTVTYSPGANFNGTDSFTFKANDGSFDSNVGVVSLEVKPVNDAPLSHNTTATTDEDTSVSIMLVASDVDSATLAFSIVNAPLKGALSTIPTPNCVASGNGSNCTVTVTYTPNPDFSGSDNFAFRVNDGNADSNTATAFMVVNAVNDPPVAQGQALSVNEDSPVIVTLAASDIDNSSLSFSIVTEPAKGTLGSISTPNCVASGNGANCSAAVIYTPGVNFNGSDTFTFKANDGSLDSNTATASITINPVNDLAVAANDVYNTLKDQPLVLSAPGVLGNDNDIDGAQSSLTAVLVAAPTSAAEFTLNSDGSFSYTPLLNFIGTDAFIYKASDGINDSNEATVMISVIAADNVPLAANDFYNSFESIVLDVSARGVLANDNDADTPLASLTAVLVAGPSRAQSFTLNLDGSFSYTPASGFRGFDSFIYKANDGSSDSNLAMATIAINPVNAVPVAVNDNYAAPEDTVLSLPAPGVVENDVAVSPGQNLTVQLVDGPKSALDFQLNQDGSFTYTPVPEASGVDTFAYRVFDGMFYSNVAMTQINVTVVNDPPVAQSQNVTTNENSPVIVTLTATDIDSTTLTLNVTTAPSHGTISATTGTMACSAQGRGATCTATTSYSPALNYAGPDSFAFVVSDGTATGTTASVSLTVNPVNVAPAATAGGPYSGTIGAPVQFNGSGTDPDNDALTFAWSFGDGSTGSGAGPNHIYSMPGNYAVTLTVTDPLGASGSAQTTASIGAAVVLNPIGNKTVNLGEALTFTVTASSSGGVPFGLFVGPLPLMHNATFNARTGVFTFRPATTQVGVYQLTFTAAGGVASESETITITVPQPPPGGTTGVRGRVVNLAQTPLSNVRVTVKSSGHTALSGSDGFFTVTGTPSGTQPLIVNGREANLGVYAIIAVAVDLIEGVLNYLNSPISLPDVDVDAEVQVSPTFNTVVTNPSLPGVELEIIGGSATNPDGTPFTGKLSINPVPDYGRPESRPEELRPGFAVTIQPAGIRFNPPARITFPNADGMAPGNDLNLWSLSPDTGKFNIVGKGVVSADGQSIITVEGGVSASAWHFPLATSTTSNPNQGNNFCGSCRTSVGSDANLEEGSLFLSHSLPSYRSLGQSRSLSLTYSSVTADPRPIVALDTTLGARAAVPNTFSTRLKVGGVQQGGEIFTHSSSLPEDADSTSRLSVQFDGSTLVTGRYPFEATVFSNYLNSSVGGISTGNLIVVNRVNSPLGAGWAITDLQQLHLSEGGILLTSGDGTALFFSGGPDTFVAPARDFSTLVKNPDGTYTRTFKDGTKINFNALGLQTSVIDRNTNGTNFAYDGNGRLITVTDPVGSVTTLTYANGKLQRINDPAGRATLFQYDGVGNLTRITNPDASFITYTYDARGHITRAANERGLSTLYTYDFAGRFAQSTRPTGETRGLVSTKLNGLADTAGGQGTPTNPAPIVTSQNATAALTDGRGNQSRFSLDGLGQVTSQTDPLGQTTTTVRDSNGLPTRITRPNGAVTTMTYDLKGNLLTATDPVGATTTFTYEPVFNQVKTIRDPKGNVTTINYDDRGNPIEIIDALNHRTQMTYDVRGLLTSVTAAVGTPVQNTASFTYDARGNLLTTTDPRNNVTTLAYDNVGNVFRSMDAENRVTEFAYDPGNRLVSVLDADLKMTQYGYDPKGNLTQVRDAKNQLTTFVYDGLDRLVSATNPLGLPETFAYDTDGNLISSTNRNGQTLSFDYDVLNRLTSKTRPPTSNEAGNQVTSYLYDSVGNLARVTNPTTTIFNQYDAANRLISSLSTTESLLSETVVAINVDTTIGANSAEFEGKTLQVNGRTLTVNGTHNFANLILVNGAVLTHGPTTASTSGKLDITVFGNIQVDATSRIDVSGKGFLGGRQTGNPLVTSGMTVGFQAGSGGRSGGSYGGLGGSSSGIASSVYGSFRDPNEPGSGGASDAAGRLAGNGGGLIRIVAQTLQLDGVIRANGGTPVGDCCAGGGSGGGIRIDVATLTGTGQITANGSNGTLSSSGGGGGRIAIHYQNATGFDLGKVNAFGGLGNTAPNGGAGTVYLQGPMRTAGELVVDNNNVVPPSLSTPIPNPANGSIALTNLRVKRNARIRVDSQLNLANVLELSAGAEFVSTNRTNAATISLTGNSVIDHLPATAAASFKVDLSANTITIDPTSRIEVSARGFLGGRQSGNPLGNSGMTLGFQTGSTGRSGGSYGGLGGSFNGAVSSVYGNFRDPNEPGSGGASDAAGSLGGNGGGLIRIVAQALQLDGSIKADGGTSTSSCCAGGGSGGGIRIDVGTLSGAGQITAHGGSAPNSSAGGAGGRVAVYYQAIAGFTLSKVTAFGGVGSGAPNGGAGTVYLQGPSRENGEVVVDNNNVTVASLSTPIPNPPGGNLSLTNLRVRRQARVRVDSVLNLTGTLEIISNGEFLSTNRINADVITLSSTGVLGSLPATASTFFKVDINAVNLTVDGTSRIDVVGQGLLGGSQSGNPFGGTGMRLGFLAGSTGRSGGSYGGAGGSSSGTSNAVYGDFANPNEPGSSGATDAPGRFGGSGGGLIRIIAQTLQLNGAIRADGATSASDCCAGGGSGGGIRVDVGTLSGTGQITANGGGGALSSGGGGGGRIAIYHQNAAGFNFASVAAQGGASSSGTNGQNGSIHLQQQVAALLPAIDEPAVQYGNVEDEHIVDDPIPAAAVRLRSNPGQILHAAVSQPETWHDNLYLAMIAKGESRTTSTSPMSGTIDDLDPIYTYDLNGSRVSMIDPTGLTTYAYDSLNRLTSITNPKGQTTTFTYDALGRRTSMTRANGVVTTYAYDTGSQLTSLAHQLGAATINSFAYAYDRVGNRTSKTNRDGAHSYTYDTLNRLTQALNPLPTSPLETFSYDPVGNRANSNQSGASNFNQANQLLEDANFAYQYDNNGNMTRKTAKAGGAVTEYEYDAENKLVRVVSSTGTTANYKYDGLGRRVEKEVITGSTTTTRYVYDNEDILLELNGANTIVARYTHGPGIDEPLIMEKNAQSFYYHADGLGSITEMTNQSGTVVQRYTYSSFGKIESQLDASFVQQYTFTGRELDQENGLQFYRTRNYDSSLGRFLQPDLIGFFGGPNLYSYVGNNPVYSIDPLGLDAIDDIANYSAGFGDMVSFGITNYIRDKLGSNHVVDQCSAAYSAGWWTGMFHQLAFSGAGAFHGGARTVFYSGEGALEAARAGKGAGRLIEDTLGGKLLNLIDKNYPIPDAVWKGVSGVFTINAKGEAQAFLRNPEAGRVWNTVERPMLDLVNKVYSAATGTPATRVIPR